MFLKCEIITYESSISKLKIISENCLLLLRSKISSNNFECFKTYMDKVIGIEEDECFNWRRQFGQINCLKIWLFD